MSSDFKRRLDHGHVAVDSIWGESNPADYYRLGSSPLNDAVLLASLIYNQ